MKRGKQTDARVDRYLIKQQILKVTAWKGNARLAIFFSGWEPRALEWCNGTPEFEHAIVIKFDAEPGTPEYLNAHNLSDELAKRGVDVKVLNLEDLFNIDKNINLIDAKIREFEIPLLADIFIECTAMPRVYLQRLFYFIFKNTIAARITIGYAAGKHSVSEDINPVLTEGKWRIEPIAPGRASVSGDSKRVLIVLLGIETDRTLDLIREVEPREVRILVPHSAVQPDLDTESRRCANLIAADADLSNTKAFETNPQDLIEALRACLTWGAELGPHDRLSFCGLGPKPLSLIGVLLHLSGREIDVFSRIPGGYIKNPTEASGLYAVYEFIDLCHPLCRLLPPQAF